MSFKRLIASLVIFLLLIPITYEKVSAESSQVISVKLSNYIGNKTELYFSFTGAHSVLEDKDIILEESIGNELKKYKVNVESSRLVLYDYSGNKIKDMGTSFTINAEKYDPQVLQTIYGNTERKYLGDIQFTVESGKYVRPINLNIPFEDYLKGVVPREMPAGWNIEALKAQAVAARTYSAGSFGKTVADTQGFQVYGGYDWHPNSTKAVVETKGKILKYNGSRISAVFSSSNGGTTESNSNLWGGSQLAYLPVKNDPYDPKAVWSLNLKKDLIDTRKLDLKNPNNWWSNTNENSTGVANLVKNELYKQNDYKNTEIKVIRIPNFNFMNKNSSGRSQNATITAEFFVKDKSTKSYRMQNGSIQTFKATVSSTANSMRTALGTMSMKSTLVTSVSSTKHTRLGGNDRFDVAINVSKNGWSSANTVVLANWDAYGDALAAAPLAFKYNAPILLTKSSELNSRSKQEIQRLKAKSVIIVGGTISVPEKIANELRKMGITVTRIDGKNRVEVANNIAKHIGINGKVVIADGFNHPDALSIAPYAARNGHPILLTNKSHNLESSTENLIKNASISQTIISGGPLSVSDKVFKTVPKPIRFGGNSRFEVSANIANAYFSSSSTAFITRGSIFADALTGSVLAAKRNAPILLTEPNALPTAVKNYAYKPNLSGYVILGGPISVSDNIAMNLPNLSYNISGKGFGHGVGMSQHGANEMARQGKKYNDILNFYYPGAKLEDI
ncbi:SpoIID/LytB domain-containing protein [Lederbergia wuyishanensis]|uniref:SpoIID/LytB domain protein n=1 Tax=Lederbergia wuyishanensis TaxID=1347903 RepID=A0ABU0D389_9BACI|nr:SpoIID/LytB domain-containing protein [Lederbergia wuyishanensis]MCJ8007965.1 SpoIID/LytB domain-containing protein [Lederbergia wuyishanensis]MDQ0342865.1 SpoIID/LytB domain protein [Lederbergia wuyishanensis]